MTSRSAARGSVAGGPAAGGFAALDPVIQHHVVNTLGWTALRPLQEQAISPVLSGSDALLLAPTAGGKTEAALLPLLSRMSREAWPGTSVLYVCPLKALLNNLEPRVDHYAQWVGRSAQVRHGDTAAGARRRQLLAPPDVLLTTPESLESMLISTQVDPKRAFGQVRAVVVDEVHAFAGDDRGWHLLGVLERVSRLAGRPLQRIGLSATVGNAEELLAWLQGGNVAAGRPAAVVAPEVEVGGLVDRIDPTDAGSAGVQSGPVTTDARVSGVARAPVPAPELELDFVGSVDNAATVISALHRGEKRLVFADSRRTVESLALALREREVETFVSHSSLSIDERRRAETAFAEARDCVIVSTSTLELGIDVGDLDRVVQVGAPMTVASVLQRLGRTGRRPGTSRNMLFLATEDAEFLRAAGLLLLWSKGFVEPVQPPPQPRHVLAQQLLGLVLQEGRVGDREWTDWFAGISLGDRADAEAVAAWQLASGHLDRESGLLFAGPEAERRYGRIHYRDLMAVFTADPEVRVLHGRTEIGTLDPTALMRKVDGPRIISLAGRSWQVNYIDWKRRIAFVEPSTQPGVSKWMGISQPQSFALSDAIRRLLLGATPAGVSLTRRTQDRLADLREGMAHRVDDQGTVVAADDRRVRWWTWAGARANAVLAAAIDAVEPDLLGETITYDNWQIALRGDATPGWVIRTMSDARKEFGGDLTGVLPLVDERAVRQLKFAEMLPPDLAHATLAARLADPEAATLVCQRRVGGSA